MSFEQAYDKWMRQHLASRTGERLRRLKEGHAFGEKLFLTNAWYPAVGHFEDLHPEYEVYDYRDGSRFLDHAFIRPPHKINWETDPYGTHLKNISRRDYDDGLDRQNTLVLDGWKIFRFSIDQLKDQPRKCQRFVQQVMGRLYGGNVERPVVSLKQREIVRMAAHRKQPITAMDVCQLLQVGVKHARQLLKELVHLGMLVPASGKERITAYVLGPRAGDVFQ